jgi:hypothetical protein
MRALVVVAGLGLGLSAAADSGVEAGKVYSGPEGLTVTVVPLKPAGDRKVLVQVDGSGTEFDGKALPHAVDGDGERADYDTQIRGRDYRTLYRRNGQLHVNLQGHRDSVAVNWDEAKTKALDGNSLWQRYQQAQKDGSLAALQRFDRKREEKQQEKGIAEVTDGFRKACGSKASLTVAWSSVDDEMVKSLSLSSYCGAPLEAMRRLCESAAAKQAIVERVKSVSCKFGAQLALAMEPSGTLAWTTSKDGSNLEEFARDELERSLLPAAKGPAPDLPWGAGQTLAEKIALEKTHVCSDGKSHFVVIAPSPKHSIELFTGDGKTFARVPPPEGYLSGEDFLDPRYYRKESNPNFRGMDMRVYSSVSYEDKKGCKLRCGSNERALTVLPAADAAKLLLAGTFQPPLQKYKPYALLRDDRGNYYYVDRGARPGEEKRYRMFLGPKGSLKEQKMTNVVSDSEGDIFATKTGSLRLIIDKSAPATWIQGEKRTPLKPVPIGENLPLIYNELGVYLGERLGTPCDDF